MYSDIVILMMLSNQPMHGYEIKKRVEQVLGGSISLNNKVLYPTLKRFEELNAVEREVVHQEGKPDRHIYRITDHGLELMQMFLEDASPDLLRHEAEFLVRVSMFHRIEPEAQRAILRTRAEIVTTKIAHIQEMRQLASENNADDYALAVIDFHEQQDLHELDWIQSLIHKIS
jgi:DNA-binding PadR family transcriptional regulator